MSKEPDNMIWNLQTMAKGLLGSVFLLAACATFFGINGCATAKDNEINAIKFEKQSTASEVDQYITTAGKVIRFFHKDAK